MNVKYCVMHVHPLKENKSVMKDVRSNHVHVPDRLTTYHDQIKTNLISEQNVENVV